MPKAANGTATMRIAGTRLVGAARKETSSATAKHRAAMSSLGQLKWYLVT
jgi:hypothetical protein